MSTPTPAPTSPSFSGSNESWYIWIECVPTTLLMPLFIVLVGIICQAFIAYFISFPNEEPEPEEPPQRGLRHQVGQASNMGSNTTMRRTITRGEVNSNCGCCSSCKKSGCGSGTEKCLIVWQIITMLVIFILDCVSFSKWHGSNYIDEVYDSTTWNNYQCLSARIVISSNYSLCVLNTIAVFMNPDWQDYFRIAWNVMSCFCCFCYCIWLLMYGLVGAFYYIWVTIVIVGPAVGCIFCCTSCKDSSPLCFQCCLQVYMPIILMFFVGVMALTMINVFEGMDYWLSFENVLMERRWEDYKNSLNAESVFRALTAFVG
eukprot:641959_1